MAARMAIMAITTSSSISVKAGRGLHPDRCTAEGDDCVSIGILSLHSKTSVCIIQANERLHIRYWNPVSCLPQQFIFISGPAQRAGTGRSRGPACARCHPSAIRSGRADPAAIAIGRPSDVGVVWTGVNNRKRETNGRHRALDCSDNGRALQNRSPPTPPPTPAASSEPSCPVPDPL